MPGYARKIKESQHPKIIRMYGEMSAKKIADKYEVTPPAILKILRKNGVTIRGCHDRAPRLPK